MSSNTSAKAVGETSRSSSQPLGVRVLNSIGRALGGNGARWVSLDPDRLIRHAEQATGFSDWGPGDLRGPLQALTRSLRDDAQLNLMGHLMMRQYLERILANRLRVQNDIRQNPEILDVTIKRPLFIVGLPRTGSTLLQRLLARDPAVRSLQTWEMWFPSPPPRAETYYSDPRISLTERRLRMLNWTAPEFASVHEVVAGEPEECISLLQASLVSSCFELMARIPSYVSWLNQQDQHQPYAQYKRHLQLLQWKHPKDHWVLKSPFHLFGLEALLDVFPDAVIVQTHREPINVIPSFSSLYHVMHRLTSDQAQARELGPYVLERLAEASDTSLDLRQRYGPERFFDVSYLDLVKQPFATVQRIYDRFGYEMTPDALSQMQAWLAASPQHKHGVHRYTLEEFGLTAEQVNTRFSRYRDSFAPLL